MTRIKSVDKVLPILMMLFLSSAALAQTPKREKHWVSAWSSAMHAPLAFVPGQAISGLENRTLRMIVRPTIGGERLRIRFSNECGNLCYLAADGADPEHGVEFRLFRRRGH